MSDPAILFVKPKAISAKDKKALGAAGVIVVEVEDPSAVKFTRAAAELSSGDMLRIAAKTIRENGLGSTREAFARLICLALEERRTDKSDDKVSK